RRVFPGPFDARGHSRLLEAPPRRPSFGLQSRAERDAVKPVPHHPSRPDGRRPTEEDEERRLQGVVRVGLVAQDALADPQYHRAVPANQRLEGALLPPGKECCQQQIVRLPVAIWPQDSTAKLPDDRGKLARRHVPSPTAGVPPLILHWSEAAEMFHFFLSRRQIR